MCVTFYQAFCLCSDLDAISKEKSKLPLVWSPLLVRDQSEHVWIHLRSQICLTTFLITNMFEYIFYGKCQNTYVYVRINFLSQMSEYRIQNTFSDRLIRNLHEDKEQEWSLTSIFFFKGPFAHDGNGNLVEQQRQKEPKIEMMRFCTYL